MVLDSDIIESSIVNTEAQGPILLFNKKDGVLDMEYIRPNDGLAPSTNGIAWSTY